MMIISIFFKLRNSFSKVIRQALKNNRGSKNGISCMAMIEYTIEQLKQHLRSFFFQII